MFKNRIATGIAVAIVSLGVTLTSFASAEQVPITGTVQSRCIIQTDTAGTYGNPNAYTLTTAAADGGDPAVVRYDVSLANAYYAEITPPTAFSTAPNLPDVVTWAGSVSVKTVSDASGMGTYESSKLEVGDTDRYDLTATGSTWFAIESTMKMFNKRADVEYYELGVFDKNFEPVPFVTAYNVFKLEYLGHVTFDIYIRAKDKDRAYYVCSKSKIRKGSATSTPISSKICSKFEDKR